MATMGGLLLAVFAALHINLPTTTSCQARPFMLYCGLALLLTPGWLKLYYTRAIYHNALRRQKPLQSKTIFRRTMLLTAVFVRSLP